VASRDEWHHVQPNPGLVVPAELAEDGASRAAASLVAAVLFNLHHGKPCDDQIIDAAEGLSLAMGTPLDAIAYISRLRRHLRRLESVPKELTDDVIDAALRAVVARGLADKRRKPSPKPSRPVGAV
jgi:hypothetical protein